MYLTLHKKEKTHTLPLNNNLRSNQIAAKTFFCNHEISFQQDKIRNYKEKTDNWINCKTS